MYARPSLVVAVLAALLVGGRARAAETPAETPPTATATPPATTATPPAATMVPATTTRKERAKLLVIDPRSTVVDASTRKTLAGLIGVELTKQPVLDVLTSADIERLTELEGQRQVLGCEAESCMAELANAMGARYVVYGDIGQLGTTIVFNLNLFDSQGAAAINRAVVQGTLEEVGAALPATTRSLVAPLVTALGGTNGVAPASTSTKGFNAGTVALATTGTLLVVVAGAYDLFAPSSANGVFDIGDAVGPTGLVVGIASVGVALALSSSGGAP